MAGFQLRQDSSETPVADPICDDCAGFDYEWMYSCKKHGTQFCRGCACPECAEEEWDDYEENGPMDLEVQLDALLAKAKRK